MSLISSRRLALLLPTGQFAHLNRLITSGSLNARLTGTSSVANTRQLHCSQRNSASKLNLSPKKLKTKSIRTSNRSAHSPAPPRFVHGPTLPGLRIVVRALQNGDTAMHTREIWETIHNNSLGTEYAFPEPKPLRRGKTPDAGHIPEPTYPTHPVRSLRYLKSVLLTTLEANGRVRKIHSLRPPNEDEKEPLEKRQARIQRRNERKAAKGEEPRGLIPEGIDTWVWELISPPESTIAVEQRDSIPMSRADLAWMNTLSAEALQQFENPLLSHEDNGSASTSIIAYRPGQGYAEELLASPRPPRPSQTSGSEQNLADKLATKFQNLLLKDKAASARAGVHPLTEWTITGKRKGKKGRILKVDWKALPEEIRAKRLRRKALLGMAPDFPSDFAHGSVLDWSEKGKDSAVGETKESPKESKVQTLDLFDDNQSVKEEPSAKKSRSAPTIQAPRPKPRLNALELEYRQSRRDINGFPIGLVDPRRRQYGFHYGLPKQKELLRAANAREHDQEEWQAYYQPPRDFSHLSVRRQRRREEQFAEIICMGKKASVPAENAEFYTRPPRVVPPPTRSDSQRRAAKFEAVR